MYTLDMALVGQRVKSLRELRGLSVGEVSSKSGVTITEITGLEAGESMGVHKFQMIVEALDGSCEEILSV